jgi:hypothetical protein
LRLPSSYLTERVTLDEVLSVYDFAACSPEFRKDWQRLLSKRQDGDELWRFAPPPGEIEVFGIALVRNGEVVATLVEAVA